MTLDEFKAQAHADMKAELRRLTIKHWVWRIWFYGIWTIVITTVLVLAAWSSNLQ